jgi:hypothetical protein
MRFKTTQNIFKDFSEVFEQNWMDSNVIITPSKKDWDYKRPMQIEDVDIWEVIYEESGGIGVYASWSPYAEFYMVRVGWILEQKGYGAETYYGAGAMKNIMKRMDEMKIPYASNQIFIAPEDMWLYK